MRILIYGAGVIGCELAHELCKGENDVTILARGNWKRSIDRNGLIIRHYGQMHTTKDSVNSIEELGADDEYDLIFVTMQYNQVPDILPQIAKNASRRIVMVGNNMTPSSCQEQIRSQPGMQKEVAFGFQGTGGYRENGKVISMHPIHVGMTIGGLREELSSDFQECILSAFKNTGYRLTWERNMEGWLMSHASRILPTAYLCYSLDCQLRRASKQQIRLSVNAVAEAHHMLNSLGYPIRPDGEAEAYQEKRRKKQRGLFWMLKTPAGKYVIGIHCAHAVAEMTALDLDFEKLKQKAGIRMPAWDTLRTGAMTGMGNG